MWVGCLNCGWFVLLYVWDFVMSVQMGYLLATRLVCLRLIVCGCWMFVFAVFC